MKNEQIYLLCVKDFTGEITPDEKAVLNKWIESSAECKKQYDSVRQIWQAQSRPQLVFMPDEKQAWRKLERMITNENNKFDFNTILNAILGRQFRPAVLAVCALILIGTGMLYFKSVFFQAGYQQIVTKNKQSIQIDLPDGSSARLNSASSIRFLPEFSDTERVVFLTGEAFFKVKSNGRPFIVVTKNAKTTVLGTEFNVWAREGKTKVVVKAGRVRLSAIKNAKQNVELKLGQMSEIFENNRPHLPRDVDMHSYLAWINGQLIFAETPLVEVLSELHRQFDVNLQLVDSSLAQKTLTAAFNGMGIEEILTSICLTLDTQFQKQANDYIIGTGK